MVCKHCGKPIYYDGTATNSSGYWFHDRPYKTGDNGFYCDAKARTTAAEPK